MAVYRFRGVCPLILQKHHSGLCCIASLSVPGAAAPGFSSRSAKKCRYLIALALAPGCIVPPAASCQCRRCAHTNCHIFSFSGHRVCLWVFRVCNARFGSCRSRRHEGEALPAPLCLGCHLLPCGTGPLCRSGLLSSAAKSITAIP